MGKNKDCKYRLIKKYPGSPGLGTIITKSNGWSHLIEIANQYPEFWEEIVEKDYEILSFKQDSKCSDLWTKFSHGWCRNSNGEAVTYPYTDDEILNNHLTNGIKYNIHSVKRLSDGEIFTVGDNVNYSYNNEKNQTITKKYIIEKIYFIEKERVSFYVGEGLSLGLNSIKKVIQPLFTTEDGVDIYEGDKLSTVLLDTMELYTVNGLAGSNTTPSENFKYFSTKKAAEEYVLMNKPCLSINDLKNHNIFNARSLNKNTDKYLFIEELKELVKSKLK